MSKKRPVEDVDVSDAIFGDLMCQMLTFFILLYTIVAMNVSVVEANFDNVTDNILEQIKASFRTRLGVPEEEQPEKKEEVAEPIIQVKEVSVEELEVDYATQIVTRINDVLDKEAINKYIDVILEEHKIRLIFSQPILFHSGYANLLPGSDKYLDPVIIEVLSSINNDIIIEGHTDNVPIKNNMYKDNWELSLDRAYNLLKYMANKHKLDPSRISAVGYGEYRPITDNLSRENRAKNRRIEINILLHSNIL
jgi:chemotaxis protein MotB